MARTKTAYLHCYVRPITKMVLRRMAEEESSSMTEVMEQAVLDRACRDYPELVDVGGANNNQ